MTGHVLSRSLAVVASLLVASAACAQLRLDARYGIGGVQAAAMALGASSIDRATPIGADRWMVLGKVANEWVLARVDGTGRVDNTFGQGGVVPLGLTSQAIGALRTDAAGRIVYAARGGSCAGAPCLYRHLADGRLDPSFPNGGSASPPVGVGTSAFDFVFQPDGRIVVAGQTERGLAVTRLAADGQIDATYGTAGTTVIGSPQMEPAGMAIDPVGGLVLGVARFPAGFSQVRTLSLRRLTADGVLDASFVGPDLPGVYQWSGDLAREANGDYALLATGGNVNGISVLLGLDAAGVLRLSFGAAGVADTSLVGPQWPSLQGPALQRDANGFLVPGASAGGAALARLTAAGALDGSFGAAGVLDLGAGTGTRATLVSVSPSGAALAATLALGRYTSLGVVSNGLPGPFREGGIARPLIDQRPGLIDPRGPTTAVPLADGRLLLLANGSLGGTGVRGALRLLSTSGSPDLGFGVRSVVLETDWERPMHPWTHAIQQPDGRILVVGPAGSGGAIVVARADLAGALDPTFGASGLRTIDNGGASLTAHVVALQPDRRILVLATDDQQQARVYRLLANGALDTGFGSGGFVPLVFPAPYALSQPGSLHVGADGKIVFAGTCHQTGMYSHCFARLTASGSVDGAFGSAGYTFTFPLQGITQYPPPRIRVLADGTILHAGVRDGNAGIAIAVGRLTADGRVDSTFGAAGAVTITEDFWSTGRFELAVRGGDAYVAWMATDLTPMLSTLAPTGAIRETRPLPGVAPGTFTSFRAFVVDRAGRLLLVGPSVAVGQRNALVVAAFTDGVEEATAVPTLAPFGIAALALALAAVGAAHRRPSR